MKSEWKVSLVLYPPCRVFSNYFDDKKQFMVYRNIDITDVNHPGNRENYGKYFDKREQAEALAAEMNRADGVIRK